MLGDEKFEKVKNLCIEYENNISNFCGITYPFEFQFSDSTA